MDKNHNIIYVMRHVDIGGNIEAPYKKIGITGSGNATLDSRLQQLTNTKSPIQVQCIAAWQHEDARKIEKAIHSLLEDSRIEGEWFIDQGDNLVDRMQPLMALLEAKCLTIEKSDDAHTKSILKSETESNSKKNEALLLELRSVINFQLRENSERKGGPTLFSDKTNLTYYVNRQRSGERQLYKLHIGRSSKVFNDLSQYLEVNGYTVTQNHIDDVVLPSLFSEVVAEIINLIESGFASQGAGM